MMSNSILGLGQLAITVSDVQQALGFYRDKLDLTFLFQPSEQLAFLQCGDTRIMLTTPQGAGEVGKNSIPYLKVSNIQNFFEQSRSRDVKLESPPHIAAEMSDHTLWMGFLRDPDDNLIGIMEERPK